MDQSSGLESQDVRKRPPRMTFNWLVRAPDRIRVPSQLSTRPSFPVVSALTVLSFLLNQTAWAEETREPRLPTKTTAPPALFEKKPPEQFRCQRLLTYNGRVLGCDSNVRADGEKLRPILHSVPDAETELDRYQKNQAELQNVAYFSTAGLLILLYGTAGGAGLGKEIMLLGGGSLFAGSILFGVGASQANEAHLENAISLYNQAHPEMPIQPLFEKDASVQTTVHRESRLLFYTGAAGLVILFAGLLGGDGLGKQLMQYTGAGILGGSLAYGLGSSLYLPTPSISAGGSPQLTASFHF